MRKALIIGIDAYSALDPLHGCVNDAESVTRVLEVHGDGARNFDVRQMTAAGSDDVITRAMLKDAVRELFADEPDIALLYFAGHGHVEATGGYLCSSDCERGDDGLSLDEVLTLATRSKARAKFIILDCCHSGVAGNPAGGATAALPEGLTILTASTSEQYASEEQRAGVFTTLLVDALNGAAANLVGDITPGSIYAHIDQSLGPWRQRPVFKTNVKRFEYLRKVEPPIPLADLRKITTLFPEPQYTFPLDPSYEPELRGRPDGAPPPNPIHTARFAILQRYQRVGLVVPVGAPHLWHAAIESKACTLTVLGEHYRRLVADKLL